MTKYNAFKSGLVVAALAMVLVPGLTGQVFAANTALIPVSRTSERWVERHESMNKRVREGQADLIWIGDSIVENWENQGKPVWDEYYGQRNAVNLGISGDRTEHVLWRLDHGNLEGISPKLAIVMIGQNNYKSNTAEEIGEGITAVVSKVREKLPTTKILLLAIFPLGEKPDADREKLAKASEIGSKTADAKNVFYMDINKAFLEQDGTLPKSIMPDFEHPNEQGHRIWAEAIEPTVAELLGEIAKGEAPKGFASVFNGKDLGGWEQISGDRPCWGVENGLLYTDGGGGGWLSTTKEYSNFEIMLEFRMPVNGNSGVFIRAPRDGNPAYAGSEIQLLDDYGDEYKTLQPWQYCGSIYSTVAPSRRVTYPAGEWQFIHIRAQGPKVSVVLNGCSIVDGNLSEHLDSLEKHPGLARTGGFIGLQNHSTHVDFRNIFLRDL
jgi:beta-glucosidase